MIGSQNVYEVRPRDNKRGVDLISDCCHLAGSGMAGPMQSAMQTFYSRSHHAVIRVYDDAGNVIETHEQAGDFKEW
jgi:hypothetical protein